MTTIGSLTNVPAPGDPITSPWAQDASRRVVHVFANKTALAGAAWPGLADGAQAYTTAEKCRWERQDGQWWTRQRGFTSATVNSTGGFVINLPMAYAAVPWEIQLTCTGDGASSVYAVVYAATTTPGVIGGVARFHTGNVVASAVINVYWAAGGHI